MKQILNTDEINKIVNDTIEKIEAKKGTSTAPFIKMDLSIYSATTVEAIKEAFIAAGVRFEDRWNDGSDFVVPIDITCAPPAFRSGRSDAFTRSDGPICDAGKAIKHRNLGRKDVFTKSACGIGSNPNHEKKSLSSQIQAASNRSLESSSLNKSKSKESHHER